MPSKVTIPNTFATATTAIPLSQLDANFSNVNAAINNALTFSNYALDAGTANTYSVSITGQTTTYAAGLAIQFLALNTNTGASTLNVNAQGAKTIVNTSGAALTAGAITAGAIVSVMYDGTNFQLLNDAGTQSETFLNLTVTGTTNTANLIVTQTGATFAAGSNTAPAITTTGDTNTGIFFPAADTIAFAEGGVESMRIDSAGNVGIGVTPSAWGTASGQKAFQIGTSGFALSSSGAGAGDGSLTWNGYYNGTNWIYSYTGGAASRFRLNESGAAWFTAPSGTAGNAITFTQAMTLDASGNLGIGTSSPTDEAGYGRALDIRSATGAAIYLRDSDDTTNDTFVIGRDNANSYIDSKSGNILIYNAGSERARITSGGYFRASNNGTYDTYGGTANHLFQTNASNEYTLYTVANNNSYASGVHQIACLRSASSSYSLLLLTSGNGSVVLADDEFKFRGDGNGYADGTFNNNGADYAEFFESANGQALTLGATVVLDGNKVREATSQDPASAIIGVVRPKEPSKASMVVGNTAWNKWANKYLTDDFDRYIMEDHDVVEWEEQVLEREAVAAVEAVVDEEGNEVSPAIPAQEAVYKTKQHSYESHNIPAGVTVPADAVRKTHDDKGNKFQHYKLNPAWDKDAEYVNRENRPEWNIIGLLGQVKILKGQPVGDRWIKMRDVSATVEEWMIR